MKETDVMKTFNCFRNQLIKKIGTEVTDNIELQKYGYALLGARFKGVYPQDMLPVNKSGMYIMNNQTSKLGGEHWVAVVVTAARVYVWDSFGRKTKNLLKILNKNAKAIGKKVIDSDYDREQAFDSSVCGPLSLSWLLVVKKLGIANALKI
jgi:hypothetical protein